MISKAIETKDFNPAEFIGKGWKFDPNEERVVLAEMNLANVGVVSMLHEGESSITGEENLSRLKAGNHVRLGADAFLFFWENKQFAPEEWKKKTNNNTTYVFFDGDILLDPDGDRYTLYLYWSSGEWYWHSHWLISDRVSSLPSAVLASPAN